MRIIHQLRIASRELDSFHHERQNPEEEALATTSVALVVLSDLVIHGHRCPCSDKIFVAMEHVAKREYLVDKVLLLFPYLQVTETFSRYVEWVRLQVRLSFLFWPLVEICLRFLSPKQTACIN